LVWNWNRKTVLWKFSSLIMSRNLRRISGGPCMRCDRGEFVIRAPSPLIKPGRIQKSQLISRSNLFALKRKQKASACAKIDFGH
jgi:hypothetical protein